MNVFQYSMLYCLQFKRLNEKKMCMEPNEKIFTLAENFSASAKILTAIGDETRQHLILEMMKMGNCMGVRVGDITKKTNLSRPAVSHHLQIMKDAGIVKVRKEGTKNYYGSTAQLLRQALSNHPSGRKP